METMADKEERIYIGIINPKGDFCPVPMGCCNSFCDCCNGGMTRQEAISKIETRLKVFLDNLQKNKDKVMPWYTTRDIAEVVLNALLEGWKK